MKKVLFAAAVALALCAQDARAAHWQAGDVRVGPVADEVAPASAPAPKKDEKGGAAAATPSEPKGGPKHVGDENRQPAAGEVKKAGADGTKPSGPLPSDTATAPPVAATDASVTTDAPSKKPATAAVPVVPASSGGDPRAPAKENPPPASSNSSTSTPAPPATNGAPAASVAAENPPATSGAGQQSSASAQPLTAIYRIGTGDVLDIRLLNQANARESTLYTVMTGGILEYPLAGDPVVVEGLTPEELGARLARELKRRAVYDQPQVAVTVREYSSHAVLVSGLVNEPGTKIMRREAIPLYVLVAEAQPKSEAGRALVISHKTGRSATVDLSDTAAMNMLVHPGDVVTLAVRPREFFYIGGEVAAPGQKDFHAGMTLTQSVLASGGVTRAAGRKVKVSRQGADGRLVSTEYNLKEIEEGKVRDPVLQSGDRVEVSRDR